ncbi:MAG: hypothetical protein ABIZ56_05210 [Chthoniobacteraceae bacterium]
MRFIAAILYAVSVSILLGIAFGFAGAGLSPRLAACALAGGALTGILSLVQNPFAPSQPRTLSGIEWTVIVTFALFSLRAFLWLIFTNGDSIQVLSPNNLGDLSLHLTYIRFLANGAAFWPDNPIFAGGKLNYPLGIDLFNSLLSLVGVDDFRGLIWVGLGGCVCAGIALWKWGGAFVMAGFLCNGGVAGFAILREQRFADFQSELAWKSLPLALFVTQRGLLFALPAGLLLLCSWRARYCERSETAWRLPRWGEVLLYACLPVFHFHTFLFLSIVLAVWFVVNEDARRDITRLVAGAFVPATLLVLLITGFFKGASMLGSKAGWMWDDPTWVEHCATFAPSSPRLAAVLLFWPVNFGALPLFVLALVVKLSRAKRHNPSSTLLYTALGIFLLCCFVKFAPWEWDNTKLMLWSYLVVLPFLWSELIGRWPWMLRAPACVLLFFSGLVSLIGGLDSSHTGFEIARRSQLTGVASAIRGIPISERFIGWPTYNHPLLLLGRKMALGYTGHAWSHGLDWKPTAKRVEAVLDGDPDWQMLCREMGVRYLIWGAEETENLPDSPQPWKTTARLIASGDWGELYDLTLPPDSPAPAREAAP